MQCPKCMQENCVPVGSTHYICQNPSCVQADGSKTQFRVQIDRKIRFPYNQIYRGHNVHEFYRKPYLELKEPGITTISL